MKFDDVEPLSDEYICIDPELRTVYLEPYAAGTLTPAHAQEFEEHLAICWKCQEDFELVQLAANRIEPPSLTALGTPLEVLAIYDHHHIDLLAAYLGTPSPEQLAASGKKNGMTFPIHIHYQHAGGPVVGQFWNRVGQLWFRVKQGLPDEPDSLYQLSYTPAVDPAARQVFTFRAGQERRLGPFHELIPVDTISGIASALRQFSLTVEKASITEI